MTRVQFGKSEILEESVTKYKVIVEFDLNEEAGTNEFHIEANAVIPAPDWISFEEGAYGRTTDVIAAFPTRRVIAVVPDE
ncbi:MAG: hypothetical protein WCA31_03100 [Acidimicrobiales bacterium]